MYLDEQKNVVRGISITGHLDQQAYWYSEGMSEALDRVWNYGSALQEAYSTAMLRIYCRGMVSNFTSKFKYDKSFDRRDGPRTRPDVFLHVST